MPPKTPAMNPSEMLAAIARLQAEQEVLKAANAKLEAEAKAKAVGKITLKVSDKGGVSAYGLGRFPSTLYKDQWKALVGMGKDILAFIEANEGILRSKTDTDESYLAKRRAAQPGWAPKPTNPNPTDSL